MRNNMNADMTLEEALKLLELKMKMSMSGFWLAGEYFWPESEGIITLEIVEKELKHTQERHSGVKGQRLILAWNIIRDSIEEMSKQCKNYCYEGH